MHPLKSMGDHLFGHALFQHLAENPPIDLNGMHSFDGYLKEHFDFLITLKKFGSIRHSVLELSFIFQRLARLLIGQHLFDLSKLSCSDLVEAIPTFMIHTKIFQEQILPVTPNWPKKNRILRSIIALFDTNRSVLSSLELRKKSLAQMDIRFLSYRCFRFH